MKRKKDVRTCRSGLHRYDHKEFRTCPECRRNSRWHTYSNLVHYDDRPVLPTTYAVATRNGTEWER